MTFTKENTTIFITFLIITFFIYTITYFYNLKNSNFRLSIIDTLVLVLNYIHLGIIWSLFAQNLNFAIALHASIFAVINILPYCFNKLFKDLKNRN